MYSPGAKYVTVMLSSPGHWHGPGRVGTSCSAVPVYRTLVSTDLHHDIGLWLAVLAGSRTYS